ncbi:hypothetical protein BURPS305_1755 [Burkholderia pseudomallei 305]|nr:hypothetical protein BURPS305_1755 [Burkholderia pseudomallei 305]
MGGEAGPELRLGRPPFRRSDAANGAPMRDRTCRTRRASARTSFRSRVARRLLLGSWGRRRRGGRRRKACIPVARRDGAPVPIAARSRVRDDKRRHVTTSDDT